MKKSNFGFHFPPKRTAEDCPSISEWAVGACALNLQCKTIKSQWESGNKKMLRPPLLAGSVAQRDRTSFTTRANLNFLRQFFFKKVSRFSQLFYQKKTF